MAERDYLCDGCKCIWCICPEVEAKAGYDPNEAAAERDASANTPPDPTPNCGCPTGLPCYIHNDALWPESSQ